ncbi:unnamed protein product [Rhizophagus irregularis]|nr:unnamed protein product [Rhizophagus irregularis]
MSFEKRLFVLFTFNKDSKFNFNVNFVTLPSSYLEKILVFSFDFLSKEDLLLSTLAKSRFFFVVKAKIYRQLCFFFTSVLSHLLKPNFKADPSYFPLWRSLGFFSLSKLRFTANCVFFHFGSFTLGFFSLSKLRFTANCVFFHFGSFTLLKLNFKADPISKVTFHFGFFTLLNPNFKADPISKVPLLPFTSVFSCC